MRLRTYLRKRFSEVIRPKLIKEKCELCGSTSELHLHHIDRFYELLIETLQELNLNEKNTEKYSTYELKLIDMFMLGKQIEANYLTLCKKCHLKKHNLDKHKGIYDKMFYNPYGNFYYANIPLMEKIEDKFLAKLLYLGCFLDYDNYIRWGNSKNNYANKNDIHEILKGNNESFYMFYNYVVKEGFLIEEDNRIKISNSLFSRGFGSYTEDSAKIFMDNFLYFYNSKSSAINSKIGGVIKLISLANTTTNRINSSNSLIKKKLNVSRTLPKYIKTKNPRSSIEELLILDEDNIYRLNSSIIYKGALIVKNKPYIDKKH